MRISVVCVSNKSRGLSILVNGLLGQVQVDHYEARQRYNPETNRIEAVQDVPIYKRFKDFELVFVDLSTQNREERQEEVAGAKRLAAGKDPVRLMLPDFSIQYLALPEAAFAEAFSAGIGAAKGVVLVFVPDLSYPGPHFLEQVSKTSLSRTAAAPAVITRIYTGQGDDWNFLGFLLDPFCEVVGQPFDSEVNVALDSPFTRLQSLAIRQADLHSLPVDAPVGFELNVLASLAARFGVETKTMPGEAASLLRLSPPVGCEPDLEPDARGYAELCRREGTAVTLPLQVAITPTQRRPWYKRLLRQWN